MIAIRQTRSRFLFGTAIGGNIHRDTADQRNYRRFIVEHFNALVCENAMKWYDIEKQRDKRTYEAADSLLAFAEKHGLQMRGHCLIWSKLKFVRRQPWLLELTKEELRKETFEHIRQVAQRDRGRLIAWDVNNEMLFGSWFKDQLGPGVRAEMFKVAREADPEVPLFVNDYAILCDEKNIGRYIVQIKGLQARGAQVGGIGIQEHGCQRFRLGPGKAAGAATTRRAA